MEPLLCLWCIVEEHTLHWIIFFHLWRWGRQSRLPTPLILACVQPLISAIVCFLPDHANRTRLVRLIASATWTALSLYVIALVCELKLLGMRATPLQQWSEPLQWRIPSHPPSRCQSTIDSCWLALCSYFPPMRFEITGALIEFDSKVMRAPARTHTNIPRYLTVGLHILTIYSLLTYPVPLHYPVVRRLLIQSIVWFATRWWVVVAAVVVDLFTIEGERKSLCAGHFVWFSQTVSTPSVLLQLDSNYFWSVVFRFTKWDDTCCTGHLRYDRCRRLECHCNGRILCLSLYRSDIIVNRLCLTPSHCHVCVSMWITHRRKSRSPFKH